MGQLPPVDAAATGRMATDLADAFDPADAERLLAIGLALTPSVGLTVINRLRAHFGTLLAAHSAALSELQRVAGVGSALSVRIKAVNPSEIATSLQRWEKAGIRLMMIDDFHLQRAYPIPLFRLKYPPPTVFFRGNLSSTFMMGRGVAIVGTRESTAPLEHLAYDYATVLAKATIPIISGLAYGIDAAAHKGALAERGYTAAILGSGITDDTLYPPAHRRLGQDILAQGVLLCEVNPEASPARETLVYRNRLIAAFSRALIVIAAGASSGALYAAHAAHDMHIPVFAAPQGGEGCQKLLADYADPLPADPTVFLAHLNTRP